MGIAVVLSDCGVYDGSEIHETAAAMAALTRAGAEVECFAPDKAQFHVIDHTAGAPMDQTRNVLTESARIARAAPRPLTELTADQADGVVFPGGLVPPRTSQLLVTRVLTCLFMPRFPECW